MTLNPESHSAIATTITLIPQTNLALVQGTRRMPVNVVHAKHLMTFWMLYNLSRLYTPIFTEIRWAGVKHNPLWARDIVSIYSDQTFFVLICLFCVNSPSRPESIFNLSALCGNFELYQAILSILSLKYWTFAEKSSRLLRTRRCSKQKLSFAHMK